MQHSERTKIPKSVAEKIPYHYRYSDKNKTLHKGKRPAFIPKNRIITKRELRHYEYVNSYVNPIIKAKGYLELLKKEGITKSELAERLGTSRVRVTQFLSLLRLPKEQQDYVLDHGKDKLITERALRNGAIFASGVQKL